MGFTSAWFHNPIVLLWGICQKLSKIVLSIWRRQVPNLPSDLSVLFQMRSHEAESVENLELLVGETIKLESIRQPVVPPYLMLMPFIETPPEIVVEKQYALDEEGFHGCIYQLKSEKQCKGKIIVGFRDLQTGETTHRKVISVTVC